MTYSESVRISTRRAPAILVACLLVGVAAIAAALGYPLPAPSSPTSAPPTNVPRHQRSRTHLPPRRALGDAAPPTEIPRTEQPRPQLPPRQAVGEVASPIEIPDIEQHGAVGEADGVVPDGTTVFDHEIPGIANLDPALLGALRQAATDAADNGVEFYVNSGWRSREYQNELLGEAIAEYGSQEEAAQWVATADTSPHVSGDAIDIGHFEATAWLSEHGANYGLCQIYSNEPWHYELRPEAIDRGCPPMYADPTHDPRMQR